MTKELFLEIGVEEIPAGFLPKAMADMKSLMAKELEQARIPFGEIRTLATPRRLVLVVTGLPAEQPDAQLTALGPAKNVAFTPDGAPTKAAQGFARGQGVDVASLQIITTEKGEYVAAVKKETGLPTVELLPVILPRLMGNIPFKKSMHWGDFDVRFARPIHWIVALFAGSVVPFSFGPIISGAVSRGHRFMADTHFLVRDFGHYQEECARHFVIPDPARRREIIRDHVEQAATAAGGALLPDEGLLDEVTYLVEYPSVVRGTFDPSFLEVPKEVLITSMRSHQRYFSIVDRDGKLMPGFITVNNTLTSDPDVVVRGNERVLRARLSDARFFFEEDKKVPLSRRVEALKSVVYQQKLGTSYEKMERFRALAESLADRLAPEVKGEVSRAAELCKADLVTGMVGEFPEVQGIMGREYALLQGEPPEVARAIAEHYLPTQAGGVLPTSDIGAIVSIADKLDSIAGCFGVGLIPTGTADPYALRRAALGIIAIILDRGYPLSLGETIDRSLELLAPKLTRPREQVAAEVREFFRGRFVNLQAGEFPGDAVEAAVAVGSDDLVAAKARIAALAEFKSHPDFEALTIGFKRAANIVKEGVDTPVNPALFTDPSEGELCAAFAGVKSSVEEKVAEHSYLEALTRIATLRVPIDHFFEKVMVMAEEPEIRANRLALLTGIARLVGGIADFSRLG